MLSSNFVLLAYLQFIDKFFDFIQITQSFFGNFFVWKTFFPTKLTNGTNADVKRDISYTNRFGSDRKSNSKANFPLKLRKTGKTCNKSYVTLNLSRWRKSMSMTPSLTTCKRNCWNWKKARNLFLFLLFL